MGSVCVCMLDLLKLIRAAQLFTTSQILISHILARGGCVSVVHLLGRRAAGLPLL